MSDSFSLYREGDGPLHGLNPTTKIAFVFALVSVAFLSGSTWTPWVITLGVLVPLGLWAGVGRPLLRAMARIVLPLSAFIIGLQFLFYPNGDTVIFEVWQLSGSLEGIIFGLRVVGRLSVLVTAFLILMFTTHPSILMTDLAQRGLPGVLPYVITSTLQIVPQMQKKASTIIDAQRARGFETEGSITRRAKALIPLVGPLVLGSLTDVQERTVAIEARAFTRPGTKTSIHEIPDSSWEKVFRWACLGVIVAMIVWFAWRSFS